MFRARKFKRGVTAEESRRRREDERVQLRKTKREEQLQKRRMIQDAPMGGGENGEGLVSMDDAVKIIPHLAAMCHSNDPEQWERASCHFREMLSVERMPPINEVIRHNVVPRLVEFLRMPGLPNLVFEAAWALTNIASGSREQTASVVNAGGIPEFVNLLKSPNETVREQAVWALGNIAGDSSQCRNLVLDAGVMEPLLMLCQNQKLTMLRNCAWTLSNLCRGRPAPRFDQVRKALPVLTSLLYLHDKEVLTDACWALSYLSDDNDEQQNMRIQAVLQSQCCRQVVQLLKHESVTVRTPALRTIGNIVTGDDLQTQAAINSGALPALAQLLRAEKKSLRKESCWTISNITAGPPAQINAVIHAGIIPPLIRLLESAQYDIRKEATWALCNATSGGTDEHIQFLVQRGVIPPLCGLLNLNDSKTVQVALDGIENILAAGQRRASKMGGTNLYATAVEHCGGLDKLNDLQEHESELIFERAVRILRHYFSKETEGYDTGYDDLMGGAGDSAFGGSGFGDGFGGGQINL